MADFSEQTGNFSQHDKFSRLAVSSGEPSLDGSIDEDRALSDSELQNVLKSEELARQVKGPSSDALEHHCEKERIEASKRELLAEKELSNNLSDEESEKGEENDDGWEDILGSGHLKRRIIRQGAGEHPKAGQWVTIRVESSTHSIDNHERLRFVLGFSFVIDAWELVVQLMRPGEICAVFTTARFAGAENGTDDQTHEYVIELLEIGDAVTLEKSDDEARTFLNQLKERGNFYFKRQDLSHAINVYKKAIELIQRDASVENSFGDILSIFYSNLSACHAKLGDWDDVLETTEKALELNQKSAKIWFRRSEALSHRKEYGAAIEALNKAKQRIKAIERELQRIQCLRDVQLKKEKRVYKRMISGINEPKERRLRKLSFRWLILTIVIAFFAGAIHFLRELYFHKVD
jgi:tetratricopeptide (TPR) repeat protein